MKTILQLEGITVGYGSRHLLENVDSQFHEGELTALIGRNGSGKSTLIRAMAGLDKPIAGKVYVTGEDIGNMSVGLRAHRVALVTTRRVKIPETTCRDIVAMGRAPYTGWTGDLSANDYEKVDAALALSGMSSYSDRKIDSLSDGEFQRVMIARAIAQDTPLILLDEPTSFLDLPNRYELCMLLKSMAIEQRKCIVFSTHELDIAMHICDCTALIDTPRLYNMTPEKMAEAGHIQRLFSNSSVCFNPTTMQVEFK